MGRIRLYMSMSLDGFITGPDDGPEQPLGVRGGRLFNWLDHRLEPGPSGDVYAEALATGAVGFGGTLNSIIANDNVFDASTIVTVRSSDKGFHASGCGTWERRR